MNKTLLQALFVATSLVAGSVSTYADTKELKPGADHSNPK